MILFNFNVIARPNESLVARQPDSEGRALWKMFHETYMGRIILIVNEGYEREHLEHWLKTEGYKPGMYEILDEADPELLSQKIHRVAAVFGKPSWYIDNNPAVCAKTLALGIPTLLVACPYIVRPEWTSPKEIRQWDTLVSELEAQALKAAEKTWRDE